MISADRPPASKIASVDHALRLVLMLKNRPSIRVREAAEELGVAQSTAHRLLAMLVYRGFATQHPRSHAYMSGPELVATGVGAIMQLDVRQKAHPFLQRLAAVTGETASLLIMDGLDARFVDSVESSEAVRVGSRIGVNLPAYACSGGQVMLAGLPDESRRRLLDSIEVQQLTPWGLADLPSLEKELECVRERGYAINNRATRIDLIALAVPIRDRTGRVLAAISVAGPVGRMEDDSTKHLPAMRDAAAELEEQLYT